MRLLIAGGGIGGLTTALCAKARGLDVALIEQAQAFSGVGAGIQLSPNAMKVMTALGLAVALEAVAFRPEAGEIRDGQSGALKASFALGDAATRRWGAPYLHVHRADLIRVLSEALMQRAPQAIRTGASVVAYAQSSHGVTLHTTSGEESEGDALVGADGLHSVIARQMLGDNAPEDTQQIAWRAVVPVDAVPQHLRPPPTACVWTGPGRHGVTYYLRGGTLINFVGVVERANDAAEAWDATGKRTDAVRDFAGAHETVRAIIHAAETLGCWRLYDRAPRPQWSDGAVTLLGDACHPMLPFMAQGAAMAIEDAFVLTECLARDASPAHAFTRYEAARRERTARVQAASRANRARYHQHDGLRGRAETAVLKVARVVAPDAPLAALDWLYGFDATR